MKRHTKSLIKIIQEHIDTRQSFCGVEVGVWKGENAKELLTRLSKLNPLYLVDRFQKLSDPEKQHDPRMGRLSQEDFDQAREECVKNISGGRARLLVMTSFDAARRMPDAHLDFCFIDSQHDYQSVREDLELWYPKVRTGGLFCGHDYGGSGDRMGLFGVKKAVDEFAKEHGFAVNKSPGNVWWLVKISESESRSLQ